MEVDAGSQHANGRNSSSASGADAGVGMSNMLKTPKASSSSAKRRSNKQLSAKQLDKIVKNLTSVQKRVDHFRSDSFGSTSYIGVASNEDEELAEDKDQLSRHAVKDETGRVADALANLELNQMLNGEEDPWFHQRGLGRITALGQKKGPDGLALAKIAARGLKGKGSAPPDSYLHEASFVFNPLTTRVPFQSPRKQAYAATDKARTSRSTPAEEDRRIDQGNKRKEASNDLAESETEVDPSLEPLAGLSKDVQAAYILEDLLFVLSGIEGQYIRYSPTYSPEELGDRLKGASYVVDPDLDLSLQGLVDRILPLAAYHSAIAAYVDVESSLEFGTVIHALCAAIRELLKEYEILIIQLEHQFSNSPDFSLQRLWFYIHPTLRTFALLRGFVQDIVRISHAAAVRSDDEGDNDSSDEDDDDDFDEDSFDVKRRKLLAMNDEEDEANNGADLVKGGEVLSMLWDRVVSMGGDESANKLFSMLLQRAAQPYASILLRWINTGHLSDPYDEFLVMEDPNVTQASLEVDPTDEFWERRYTLRDESTLLRKERERQQGLDIDADVDDATGRGVLTGGAKIPAFLQPWKRKILLAGKYLNVIRECGRDVSMINEDKVDQQDVSHTAMDITHEEFLQQIEAAYQRSNRALLSLLLDEHDIIGRLRSIKHYFFQSQSDFFSSFLEAAGRELRKEVYADKVRDVTVTRLQSHLGMILGSSNCVGYTDPYREDVRVQLASENAYDQLKRIAEIRGGIEAARAQAKMAKQKERERIPLMELLQFDLSVHFPVSLVISRKNILRWQFLQRPIIHLKATERALCEVWSDHQDIVWRRNERGHPKLQRWKMRVFHLRHRIFFFVQQLSAYVFEEVLEPNWRELELKMESASTVDQFLKDHFDFLNLCRKECMLTDLRYVELLSKLMSVAAIFCESKTKFKDQLHMERANWQRDMLENDHQIEAPDVSDETLAFLSKIEAHWRKRITTFKDIVALLSTTNNPAALPLSYRLQSA